MSSFFSVIKEFLFPANKPIESSMDNNSNGGISMKKVSIRVAGLVQGVGFRYSTKLVADQIGVYGIVRNESDGSVYIEANGDEEKIDKFIEKIRNSPSPSGQVDSITVEELSSLPVRDKFIISN
ncbi:acylphosphatase [Carnobacterium sp. 17-4]|uniref:acylphosphatase n=1 Tax=Carnobacterium sp. (strain 17-4) TaxID=208596 RepID=UPI00020586E0|nr:acylphosphatase [Carnobacterium sp. 17-4]